jgi:hypothetical protein
MEKIYRVKAIGKIPEEIAQEIKARIEAEIQNDPDSDEIVTDYDFSSVTEIIYVHAPSLRNGFIEAEAIFDDAYEDYDIIEIESVKTKEGGEIELANLEFECHCPNCEYHRVNPDNQMEFVCPNPECKQEIKVAAGDWGKTNCINCDTEIFADKIKMGSNGKYFYEIN